MLDKKIRILFTELYHTSSASHYDCSYNFQFELQSLT